MSIDRRLFTEMLHINIGTVKKPLTEAVGSSGIAVPGRTEFKADLEAFDWNNEESDGIDYGIVLSDFISEEDEEWWDRNYRELVRPNPKQPLTWGYIKEGEGYDYTRYIVCESDDGTGYSIYHELVGDRGSVIWNRLADKGKGPVDPLGIDKKDRKAYSADDLCDYLVSKNFECDVNGDIIYDLTRS